MTKTIFKEMGGTYEMRGDYLIPYLTLQAEKETKPIGIWGRRHKCYLKQNHRVLYMNLQTSGKLNDYLAEIDEQTEDIFSRLVKDLVEKENVTETLKAENQMMWVQRMNSIRNRATEVVNADLLYT